MAAAQFPAKTPAQELPPKNAPNPTHLLRNPKRGEEGGGVACPLRLEGADATRPKEGGARGIKEEYTPGSLSSSLGCGSSLLSLNIFVCGLQLSL